MDESRGHEFEGDLGRAGLWEGLHELKGREKYN